MIPLPQRPREDIDVHPGWPRWGVWAQGQLITAAAEECRVELIEQSAKVELRIWHDPVDFAVWPGDESVQTCGNDVANLPHGHFPRRSTFRAAELVMMLTDRSAYHGLPVSILRSASVSAVIDGVRSVPFSKRQI
jgi:hypothetical protein